MEQKHHHHHKKDEASLFKERNLRTIRITRFISKWFKRLLIAVAVIMVLLVIASLFVD